MTLYLEAGFERTTVADIAERTGLTERTFFRHFSDKREVLFSGASALQERMVVTVRDAPAPIAPLNVIALALSAAGSMIGEERDRSRLRQQVIDANDDLKERELIKLAAFASAMAHELRDRGVDEPTASLAAEVGIAAFRIAFERWVRATEEGDLVQMIGESVAQLSVITGQQ